VLSTEYGELSGRLLSSGRKTTTDSLKKVGQELHVQPEPEKRLPARRKTWGGWKSSHFYGTLLGETFGREKGCRRGARVVTTAEGKKGEVRGEIVKKKKNRWGRPRGNTLAYSTRGKESAPSSRSRRRLSQKKVKGKVLSRQRRNVLLPHTLGGNTESLFLLLDIAIPKEKRFKRGGHQRGSNIVEGGGVGPRMAADGVVRSLKS